MNDFITRGQHFQGGDPLYCFFPLAQVLRPPPLSSAKRLPSLAQGPTHCLEPPMSISCKQTRHHQMMSPGILLSAYPVSRTNEPTNNSYTMPTRKFHFQHVHTTTARNDRLRHSIRSSRCNTNSHLHLLFSRPRPSSPQERIEKVSRSGRSWRWARKSIDL